MTGSALLGEPPATPDDSLIYKALVILNGSDSFPNPTQYADAVKPPNDFDGNSQLSADVALLIIVVLSTAARVWAQRYRKKRHVAFWMSNVFLFLSTSATIAYDSIVFYLFSRSSCAGRHVNYCTYENLGKVYMVLYVEQSIFYLAVYSAKLSIICLLRGAVDFTVRWWRLTNTIFMVVVVIVGIWSLLSTILTCIPVPPHYSLLALAKSDPATFHCFPSQTLQYVNRGLHIATDFTLLLFPFFLMLRLQLSWTRKALFIFPFTLGLVTITCSILRNVFITSVTSDLTWDIARVTIWDFIDINFSALITSVPFIMPLIDRSTNWFRQRSKGQDSSRSSHRFDIQEEQELLDLRQSNNGSNRDKEERSQNPSEHSVEDTSSYVAYDGNTEIRLHR